MNVNSSGSILETNWPVANRYAIGALVSIYVIDLVSKSIFLTQIAYRRPPTCCAWAAASHLTFQPWPTFKRVALLAVAVICLSADQSLAQMSKEALALFFTVATVAQCVHLQEHAQFSAHHSQ